jgi:hypothetical protein
VSFEGLFDVDVVFIDPTVAVVTVDVADVEELLPAVVATATPTLLLPL